MSRSWTKYYRSNIWCKNELGVIRPIKEKIELMFGMIQDDPSDDFIGIPCKPFHFTGKQKTGIDGNAH